MKDNDNTLIAFIFIIFLFGTLIGYIASLAQVNYLDLENVKTFPNKCSLERYQIAQKYTDACSSAFKTATTP